MKIFGLAKWHIAVLTLIGVVLFMLACSDKSNEPEVKGPDVPPMSTFLMDFDSFPGTGVQASKEMEIATKENWGWAGINVLVWNAVIVIHAAVPVAAYAESFKHTPVLQNDGSWKWTYNVIVGQDTYTASLFADTDVEGINWEMYLSKAGDFTDFLWYSGHHNLLYTEGNWTLYKGPDDPVEFVSIDWHRNLADSTADIKYTNVEPESAGNGGYIFYGIVDDPTYDAFYDIYIIEQEHSIDIEWNLESRVGRVMDETHFEDAFWHCWDEDLEDVDCID